MTKALKRRLFLSGLLAGTATGAWAAAPAASLRPEARPFEKEAPRATPADALRREAGLSGELSYAVADVRTGQMLEVFEPGSGLPPASVTKAVTTLYALSVLGAGHRFETRVMATAPVKNGILDGDLILAGGGDPTLDTDGLAALAARLKESGLREVRGRFRVWQGALPYEKAIDRSQPDQVGYNPSVSGLTLNFNRVHFEWKRAGNGYAVTMDARTARYRPAVSVATMEVAPRRMPVYSYKSQGGIDRWSVARHALGNGGARWLPVRDPGAYAGDVFRTLARSHGIVLPSAKSTRVLPGGPVLARMQSAPLREILRGMLRYSTNVTAEVVGMAATVTRKGQTGSLASSARAMSDWARQSLGMSSAKFVDHSGLGSSSRLSTQDMARALAKVKRSSTLQEILRDIPVRDAKGRPVKDHPLKVKAKTGTLNFVSCLAGYIETPGGRELAFAIFSADRGRRAGLETAQKERPEGARAWNRRAKGLQQKLITRWGTLYG